MAGCAHNRSSSLGRDGEQSSTVSGYCSTCLGCELPRGQLVPVLSFLAAGPLLPAAGDDYSLMCCLRFGSLQACTTAVQRWEGLALTESCRPKRESRKHPKQARRKPRVRLRSLPRAADTNHRPAPTHFSPLSLDLYFKTFDMLFVDLHINFGAWRSCS